MLVSATEFPFQNIVKINVCAAMLIREPKHHFALWPFDEKGNGTDKCHVLRCKHCNTEWNICIS